MSINEKIRYDLMRDISPEDRIDMFFNGTSRTVVKEEIQQDGRVEKVEHIIPKKIHDEETKESTLMAISNLQKTIDDIVRLYAKDLDPEDKLTYRRSVELHVCEVLGSKILEYEKLSD